MMLYFMTSYFMMPDFYDDRFHDAKAGVILKIYLEKKIFVIDTFTEEFYPVYENGIYNY